MVFELADADLEALGEIEALEEGRGAPAGAEGGVDVGERGGVDDARQRQVGGAAGGGGRR